MKSQFIKLKKPALVFVASFLVFFFLNTGFYEEPLWLVFQAVFFALVVVFMFLKKVRRIWLIYSALVFFIGMVVSILFESVFVAEILGSTGFGLVIILLISYLPHFIKDGYLERW